MNVLLKLLLVIFLKGALGLGFGFLILALL